jgi:CheY-like chemotaxis protein
LEALELLQRQPFAMALVDIHLPGMDGLETLEHLKSSLPTSK